MDLTYTTQGKFDVTEFVGHVSEKLIAESKADNGREWTSPYYLLPVIIIPSSIRPEALHKILRGSGR